MSSNKKREPFKKSSKIVFIGIGLLVLIGLYTISMFLPKIGGYTSYPVAILRCGKKPVALQKSYSPSGYPINYTHNAPSGKFKYADYVCTPQEARNLDDRTYPPAPKKKSPEEIEQCLDTPTKNGLHPTEAACESDMQRDPNGNFIVDG